MKRQVAELYGKYVPIHILKIIAYVKEFMQVNTWKMHSNLNIKFFMGGEKSREIWIKPILNKTYFIPYISEIFGSFSKNVFKYFVFKTQDTYLKGLSDKNT